MRLRKSEKVAAIVALVPVSMGAMLGVYTLTGPVLHTPIVATLSDAVVRLVRGEAVRCYRSALPDLIVLSDDATPATLPHEMLHYAHPDWSECVVSTYLFDTTGLEDGYHKNGVC